MWASGWHSACAGAAADELELDRRRTRRHRLLASALLRRVESNTSISQGVDWDAVLHSYLRFPKHPSWNWEEELIATLQRDWSSFKQPDLGKLRDKERSALLGPISGADRLKQRRTGVAKTQLESEHALFESSPPS
jgi:hypothetical protein